jgi:hypothetical protein
MELPFFSWLSMLPLFRDRSCLGNSMYRRLLRYFCQRRIPGTVLRRTPVPNLTFSRIFSQRERLQSGQDDANDGHERLHRFEPPAPAHVDVIHFGAPRDERSHDTERGHRPRERFEGPQPSVIRAMRYEPEAHDRQDDEEHAQEAHFVCRRWLLVTGSYKIHLRRQRRENKIGGTEPGKSQAKDD